MKMMKTNIDFMKIKWPFLLVSLVLFTLSAVWFFTKGLNYGIDFKGGLKLVYVFEQAENEANLTAALRPVIAEGFVVQRMGAASENKFLVRSEPPKEIEVSEFVKKINAALAASSLSPSSLEMQSFFGPKVGKELKMKGLAAVILAWIVMMVYVSFRFDFNFAPGALVALIHDVFIAIGAFALTGREVNLTVVAAFLTIIGYSINDTIVIYDRIRENKLLHKAMQVKDLVNKSLNETLSRTIVTSLTLLFVVLVLFFVAEGDIQNFAFAMIVGTVVGTYSSLFIASPVYILTEKFRKA